MWDNLEREFRQMYQKIKTAPSGSAAIPITNEAIFHSLSFLITASEHRPPTSSMTNHNTSGVKSIWNKRHFETTPKNYGNDIIPPKKRRSSKKVVPPHDKFYDVKLRETAEMKFAFQAVDKMLQQNCDDVIGAVNRMPSGENSNDDPHFDYVYEKLSSVNDTDLENCFITILQQLEKLR